MSFLKLFSRSPPDKSKPTVVTFTGGMGAQIISTAVYFSLRNTGHPVYADLSYFDKPESVAVVGKAGNCSHWSWQLEPFGLFAASFDTSSDLTKRNSDILQDGPQKLALGLKALAQPDIQKHFIDATDVGDILPKEVLNSFLCIHIRRGDYVNVASHLIPDEEFINLIRKFSGLTDNAVILSDSPIEPDFRGAVSPYFKTTMFLDNIDPYASHWIMRHARILVCSNSTFSLTAAALNPNALIVIPKQWYAGKDREIEAPIQARCSFQIMK